MLSNFGVQGIEALCFQYGFVVSMTWLGSIDILYLLLSKTGQTDPFPAVVMLYSGVLFMVAAVVLAAAEHISMIVIGRVLQGIAISFASVSVPIYNSGSPVTLSETLSILEDNVSKTSQPARHAQFRDSTVSSDKPGMVILCFNLDRFCPH